MKKLALFALIVVVVSVLALPSTPSQAQDGMTPSDILAMVQASADALDEADSYMIEMNGVDAQEIVIALGPTSFELLESTEEVGVAEFHNTEDGLEAAYSGELSYSSFDVDGSTEAYDVVYDLLFVDDVLYLNVTSAEGDGAPEVTEGWTEIADEDDISFDILNLDIEDILDDVPFTDFGSVEEFLNNAVEVEEEANDDGGVTYTMRLTGADLAAYYLDSAADDLDSADPVTLGLLNAMISAFESGMNESSAYFAASFDADGNLTGMGFALDLSIEGLDFSTIAPDEESMPAGATVDFSLA